jgi:hypothetical protein
VVPVTLEELPVAPGEEVIHEKAAAYIRAQPQMMTSHTVLVIDQSGS